MSIPPPLTRGGNKFEELLLYSTLRAHFRGLAFALLATISRHWFSLASKFAFARTKTCLESATVCDRLHPTCYYSPQKSPTRLPSRRLVLYQTSYVSYARMPFSAPGLAYSVLFPPLLPDRTYVPRNRVSSVRSYLERRYRVYQSRYYATSLAVSAHPPLPGRHANVTGRETRV